MIEQKLVIYGCWEWKRYIWGGGCGIKEGRRLRTIARGWKMHGKRLLLNISGLRA